MFDQPGQIKNTAVCFTSDDCNIEQPNGEINIEKAFLAPAFCTQTNTCLCNRLQLFNGDIKTEAKQSSQKCVECSTQIDGRDPCTQQDAYSFCNDTSRQCECFAISDHETEAVILITENKMSKTWPYSRSVCLHNHLRRHFALKGFNHTEDIEEKEEQDDQAMTPYDWTMTVIFVYIVPFTIVTLFLYCLIRHFCAQNMQQDSEMILYRQL